MQSSTSSSSRSITTPSASLRSGRGRSQSKCRNRSRSRSRKIVVDHHHHHQQQHSTNNDDQKLQCDRSPIHPRRGRSPTRVLSSPLATSRRLDTTSSSASQRRLDCNGLSSPERHITVTSNTAETTPPSKAATTKSLTTNLAPTGSKKIRRPLTAEELEMACQANPSLREAIAKGQMCRLGKVKLLPTDNAVLTSAGARPRHGKSRRSDDAVGGDECNSTSKAHRGRNSTVDHEAPLEIRSRKPTSRKSTRSLSKKRDKRLSDESLLSELHIGGCQSSHLVFRSPTKTRDNNRKKIDAMISNSSGVMMSPAGRSISCNGALLSGPLPPLLVGFDWKDMDSSPNFTRRLATKPKPPAEGSPPSHRSRTKLSAATKQKWSSARTLNATATMIPTTKPLGGGIHNKTIRPNVFSKQDIPSFGKKRTDISTSFLLDLQDSDNSVNVISTELAKCKSAVVGNNNNSAQRQERIEVPQSGALLGEKLCSINDTLVQPQVGRYSEAPKPPQRQKSLDDLCHPLLLRPRSVRTLSNESSSMNSSIDDSYINGTNNNTYEPMINEYLDGPDTNWCPIHA